MRWIGYHHTEILNANLPTPPPSLNRPFEMVSRAVQLNLAAAPSWVVALVTKKIEEMSCVAPCGGWLFGNARVVQIKTWNVEHISALIAFIEKNTQILCNVYLHM